MSHPEQNQLLAMLPTPVSEQCLQALARRHIVITPDYYSCLQRSMIPCTWASRRYLHHDHRQADPAGALAR